MKKLCSVLALMLWLTSCVSMKKYKNAEEDIKTKERQLGKLNTKLVQVQNKNKQLLDSAERLLK